MSFNNCGIKRINTEFDVPGEKFYKLEQSSDKKTGGISPLMQDVTGLYQKYLLIPGNESIAWVSIDDIFKNATTIKGYFFELVHYRTNKFLDLHIKSQLNESEQRILRLTLERFGTQAENSLVQLKMSMERQSKLSSPFYTQLLENTVFDIVQNGVWIQCLGTEIFKSEACLKKCLKDLFENLSQPKEREKVSVSITKILNYINTCKDSKEKDRVIDFCYGDED